MSIERRLVTGLIVAILLLAGCSSDDGSADVTADTTVAAEVEGTDAPVSEEPDEPASDGVLRILVSNDDGYEAEGIDTLVAALGAMPDVELIVYAPLGQQSGTGGRTTDGPLEVEDLELVGGHPVRAVDGYPADTIRVAMDEDGVEPHLVVTGINEGQNIGAVIEISGTVGAARAAADRGVPALATSQGLPGFDYADALPFITEWIEQRRDALLDGTEPVRVTNLNIPSCETGEIRGLLEIRPATSEDGASVGDSLKSQDCAADVDEDELEHDVIAFSNGWVTQSVLKEMTADEALSGDDAEGSEERPAA